MSLHADQPSPSRPRHRDVAGDRVPATAPNLASLHLQVALAMADLVAWHLPEGTDAITFSSNAEAVLGFALPADRADMLGLLHPDDIDAVVAQVDRAMRGDQPLETTFRLIAPTAPDVPDAPAIWVQAQGMKVVHDDVPMLVGVMRNVTERLSRERTAAVVADIGDILARLTDPDALQDAVSVCIRGHFGVERVRFVAVRTSAEAGFTLHDLRPSDRGADLAPDWLTHLVASEVHGDLRERRAVVVPDVGADHRTASHASGIATRAVLIVPCMRNDLVHMLMVLEHDHPREWPAAEVALAQDLSANIIPRLERAHGEQALAASEERYRTLFEVIDQGFCVVRVLFDDHGAPYDYRFLELNPAFEQHTGLRGASGRTAREVAPDLESHWFEIYGGVALTGESARFVQHAAALDHRWFDVNAFRIGPPEGRTVAILFTDITEAKRIQDAMLASEARLQRVIASEVAGIVIFRDDGVVTFANDAFLRLTGYPRDHVDRGHLKLDHLVPAEGDTTMRGSLHTYVREGRVAPHEWACLRRDGSHCWVLSAAQRISDDEGVMFITDITRLRRAETERDRLAAIVENSRDAVIGIDLEGRVTDWNQAACDLYGYTAAEMVGSPARLMVPPEEQAGSRRLLDALTRGEDVPPYEAVRVRKDGRRVEVEVQLSPVRDQDGRIIGGAVIARDATVRRRHERTQDDFLAMASHDLRSPVTVLQGRAQLMQRRKTYDEKGVAIILEQARRMERLVADLQIAVRVEAGGIELERTTMDLGDLARDAVERIRVGDIPHTVRLVRAPHTVTGAWDRDRLGQVLDNLIGNAVKYSPQGGEVVVRVGSMDGEARLSVRDHGMGIAAETMPELFDRFTRENHDGETAGLGLGLYISKMLVELHGGRIEVASQPGEGSTFTVILPITA